MQKLSIEEFMNKITTLDESFAKKAAQAKEQNKVLRFAATVTSTRCRAKLEAVEKNSELGSLQGRNNLVMFQTKRYFDNTLTVKGHGAGAEVTAAGVFGDLLEIVKRI